jgi:hypothetical protein
VNLDKLGVHDFFPGLEVQLARKHLIGFLRIVEGHAVFAADERPVFIDLARAVFQSRASQAQAGWRQAAPRVRDLAFRQELLPILCVLSRPLLHRQSLLRRQALHGARDIRGFELGNLEKVVAAVGAASPALNFGAVQLLVAPEFRLPSSSDFQQVLKPRHEISVLRGATRQDIPRCERDSSSLLRAASRARM